MEEHLLHLLHLRQVESMFGWLFCKKKEPPRTGIDAWLHNANQCYEHAIEIQNPRGIGEYFDGAASTYIIHLCNSGQSLYQGLDKYRNTNFALQSSKNGTAKYRKDITYDDIKINRGVQVAVGEAYSELWTLSKENNKLHVHSIERL